jgi:hypothetical protein
MKKNIIILEQPDNSGKWKKVPPPLKGKIYTNKNDVSSDGNWYKPRASSTTPPRPNPIDDTWEVITDSKLIQKIKKGGDSFWEKITNQVPSLIVKAGKYVYKKGEELEQWWEKYQKEHGNSSSSTNTNNDDLTPLSTEWLEDPTGSKMYVYQVNKKCEWLAKRVKTGEIFNINNTHSICGFSG